MKLSLFLFFSFAIVASAGEWKSLFDGKTLAGWDNGKGGEPGAGWVVEDGAIHRKDKGGQIYTTEEFGDFEFEFEWKVAKGANSGVKYKITKFDKSLLGPEFQVLDDDNHGNGKNPMTSAGSIYALFAPSKDKVLKPIGEWNTAKIVVDGSRFEHWLNGKKVLEVDTASEAWAKAVGASKFKNIADGFGKNEQGKIMLQDHGDKVWFRNLRIKETS
ncbi:MAG: DUF1080 domain-containing protein [Verrucomicrobiota bacterium]